MRAGHRVDKEQVRTFWEQEACGERYGDDQDRIRYELEPEILAFADFPSGAGKRVLEIGVGMGADFMRWARAGATATGVDLTERAVELTRARLQSEGLDADLRVADAEDLPFPDDSFDIVYSWGVLHHTPDPARALAEGARVLAQGGELRVMLYHRWSWVALAAWVRFCLFRGRPLSTLRDAVGQVESPGTQAFRPREVQELLPSLTGVTATPSLTRWDRRVAPGVAAALGNRFGWFLLVRGRGAG
jgi:SAM-dependent methyltransferase